MLPSVIAVPSRTVNVGTPVRATVGTETTIAAELVGLVFPSASRGGRRSPRGPLGRRRERETRRRARRQRQRAPILADRPGVCEPGRHLGRESGSVTVLPRVMGTPTPETAGPEPGPPWEPRPRSPPSWSGSCCPSRSRGGHVHHAGPLGRRRERETAATRPSPTYGLPFSLTDQVYVNPAAISAGLE